VNKIITTTAFVPSPVKQMGERGKLRFLEFFTANIRNPNTRRAYARASMDFQGWSSEQGVTALPTNHPISAYQV